MSMPDKELIRLEASIIDRARNSEKQLTMTGLTEVIRSLRVCDAQYLCGAFGVNDLTLGDAVIGLAAKLMMRQESR